MHYIVEDPNDFSATVPVPDDGIDFRTAASLYAAFQALANRSAYLYNTLFVGNPLFPGTVQCDVLRAQIVIALTRIHSLGDVQVDGVLSCSGSAALGAASCSSLNAGPITAGAISCASLGVSGALNVGGASTFTGGITTASINGAGAPSTYGGPVTFSGVPTFAQTPNLANGANVTAGPIALSGNARVRRTPYIGAAAGVGAFSPQGYSRYLITTTGGGAAVNMSNTGAVIGDHVEISTQDAANTLVVKDALGSTTIITLKSAASGFPFYVDLMFDGANWQIFNESIHP